MGIERALAGSLIVILDVTRVDIGIGLARDDVETAVLPQRRYRPRPSRRDVPVRIYELWPDVRVTDHGEQSGALFFADARLGFHPRAERVPTHVPLKVQNRLMLKSLQCVDHAGEADHIGV